MSPGNTRQKLWNVVIVALVVVVIIASYLFLTSSTNNAPNVYSVDEIMEDSAKYVGKIIAVDGYYNAGEGAITSSIPSSGQESTGVDKRLPVDISAVDISPASNTKYRFTGTLTVDQLNLGNPVILVATEIVPV